LNKFCREHKLAGVIIQGLNSTDPYFEQIRNGKFPSVGIDMDDPTSVFGCIGIDNVRASEDAVDLLIKKGYKNIGMYNGKASEIVCKQRLNGYMNSLNKNGCIYNPNHILDCSFSEKKAYEKTGAFLEENKELDAVFCASDLMAIGLLNYCEENNIKVPEDLAVMGFDDIPLCTYTRPRLTTVHQDIYKAGYEAVIQLINIIIQGKSGERIVLEHRIIERETI